MFAFTFITLGFAAIFKRWYPLWLFKKWRMFFCGWPGSDLWRNLFREMGWRRRMRSRLYASVSRMGTGTNPNPAPDTSEHPYECSDEDVNVLLQFCSNPVLLQWKMCQFDGCLGMARVLVKRTSLDVTVGMRGIQRILTFILYMYDVSWLGLSGTSDSFFFHD